MARTLSIQDDELGVTASVRVVSDGGGQRITRLLFEAEDGAAITSQTLLMLHDLGLALPSAEPGDALPEPPVPQQRDPQKRAGEQPVKAAAKRTPRKARYTGGKPSDAALQTIYSHNGGVLAKMAKSIGCHGTTVRSWIIDAESRGVQFTTAKAVATGGRKALPAGGAS